MYYIITYFECNADILTGVWSNMKNMMGDFELSAYFIQCSDWGFGIM